MKAKTVRAKMLIHDDGSVSFEVRGYDFRFSDMPIAVNGYLFAPMRTLNKGKRENAPAPIIPKT